MTLAGHSRRIRLVAASAVAISAVLCVSGLSAVPAASASSTPTLAFGAYPSPSGSQTRPQAVQAMEQKIGRRLAEVRVFQRWDDPLPDSYHTYLKDHGYPIILSVRAMYANGTPIKWADIANASPGSALYNNVVRWANAVKGYGLPVYFSFNQEPKLEANLPNGTTADFIAAWQKMVTVFRQLDVSNARYMWITTGYAFGLASSDRRFAAKWYPGDAYVDSIAADTYNWFTCRPGVNTAWLTLQTLIEPQRVFALAHPGKTVWLAEWASAEDPNQPGRKAQWIDAANALFSQPGYEQFEGISIFNKTYNTDTVKCAWSFDSSTSSSNSFISMANDPFYSAPFPTWGGQNQPPVAVIAPPACTELACDFDGRGSTDADGTIASYAWTFGDGGTSSVANPSHTYASAGTYPVRLTVTDDANATGSVTTSVTVLAQGGSVNFVGSAGSNRNALTHSVTVPALVTTGDALLLFDTVNATTVTESAPSGLTGWTLVDTATTSGLRTRLWRRQAQAGDAGRTVTVSVSAYAMVALQLLDYSGAQSPNPLAASASAVETVSRAAHTTPVLSGVPAGARLVSYWADKSVATTSWTPPPAQTVRATSAGTSAGHISDLVTDSVTGSGAVGGLSATANSADSRATMWSVVLVPA